MAKCFVKPYEGTEKFVFVSYAHRDSDQVSKIIERMAQDGYRVWYDEGIEPGSEWPESIAQHVNDCAVCLAFLSPHYMSSRNCRHELNFAISRKKNVLAVALEPVSLSLGMEMLLSDTQFIMKYALSSEEEFFSKLYSACTLEGCAAPPMREERTTLYMEEPDEADDMRVHSWLVRVNTGEIIHLPPGDYRLGRSPAMSSYVITGNSTVGLLHAKITSRDDRCFLVDLGSYSGTRLNDLELEAEQECLLHDGDTIWIASEQFTFHQEMHLTIRDTTANPWLSRINTGETIHLSEGTLTLGRSQALSDYVVEGNMTVSRAHAQIITRGGHCFLKDMYAVNKTWINDQELKPEKEYPLKDGDTILLATEQFRFHER